MTRQRTTVLTTVALAAVLGLVGCSSSSSATPAVPAAPTGSPTDGATTAASGELTSWLTQVCTASEQTIGSDTFSLDAAKLAQDPKGYLQAVLDQFNGVADRLRAFADQLEQIGPPDLPNGEELTTQYAQTSRELADAYDQARAAAAAETNPVKAIAAFGSEFSGERLQRATAKFGDLSQLLDSDQVRAAAADIPECSSLNLG